MKVKAKRTSAIRLKQRLYRINMYIFNILIFNSSLTSSSDIHEILYNVLAFRSVLLFRKDNEISIKCDMSKWTSNKEYSSIYTFCFDYSIVYGKIYQCKRALSFHVAFIK